MTHPDTGYQEALRQAATLLLEADYVVGMTGAGISVESGIPPFRGPGGLWTKYGEPPMNGYERFLADPQKAWQERLAPTGASKRSRQPSARRSRILAIRPWWRWKRWACCATSSPRTSTICTAGLAASNWPRFTAIPPWCAAFSARRAGHSKMYQSSVCRRLARAVAACSKSTLYPLANRFPQMCWRSAIAKPSAAIVCSSPEPPPQSTPPPGFPYRCKKKADTSSRSICTRATSPPCVR